MIWVLLALEKWKDRETHTHTQIYRDNLTRKEREADRETNLGPTLFVNWLSRSLI